MTQQALFEVHDVIFYVGTGVATIKSLEESGLGDPAIPSMYIIEPKRSDMIVRAPLNSPKIIAINTFAGNDPQKLVRTILGESEGNIHPAKVRWGPKMKKLEGVLAKAESLEPILSAARDFSRPIDDEYPLSFIPPLRWIKGVIIDTLAAVLDRDEEAVLKSVNAILNRSGKLAFPE